MNLADLQSKYFVIDKDYIRNGTAESCSVISLNPENTNPFRKIIIETRYNANPNGFGSIIQIENGGQRIKNHNIHDYNEHSYDCVVVLEKHTDKLAVFGNKIGERLISTQNNASSVERGDHLLLDTSRNAIIHNITRERMKYAVQTLATFKGR